MVVKTPKEQPALIPEKYPQGDLFVCDVADAVLKDIMPQMEHPFYSLSKKPDTAIRRYEHNGNWLEVTPSVKGLATIYDKDILIYCISQIIAKKQRGEEISNYVKINSFDLLKFTNRGTAGKDYIALSNALSRLGGTRITTNIRTNDEEIQREFGLINGSTLRRKHGLDGRLLWCEVEISNWVFNAIEASEVLTLHRDYFRLRKPLERRIYEIARKHCGQQRQWKISLSLLLKKTGSQTTKKDFKQKLIAIVASDHLPDYSIRYDAETDNVTFINRDTMPLERNKPTTEVWNGHISTIAFEQLAGLRLDENKYALESDFREWVKAKGITPKNADALFLDFCKKRQVKQA